MAMLVAALLLTPALAVQASAQDQGNDTNGDGVADDFNGDGFADDLDGDCIPDDFNEDGVPDGDATDFVCPEGKGGTLNTRLSPQEIRDSGSSAVIVGPLKVGSATSRRGASAIVGASIAQSRVPRSPLRVRA